MFKLFLIFFLVSQAVQPVLGSKAAFSAGEQSRTAQATHLAQQLLVTSKSSVFKDYLNGFLGVFLPDSSN